MRLIFSLAFLALLSVPAWAADPGIDLNGWKLQIPGPAEVKDLQGYSSQYFAWNEAGELGFHLDAAEKGTTKNAKYIRSELRHLPNWLGAESHRLTAESRVESHLSPDKVTTMQIHGITPDGGNAPPLLRIAVNEGDLVAMIKTDVTGEKTEKIPLLEKIGARWVEVSIEIDERRMDIRVNGEIRVRRDLGFWTFQNYFKAGCYPQSTLGKVAVYFRKLSAR